MLADTPGGSEARWFLQHSLPWSLGVPKGSGSFQTLVPWPFGLGAGLGHQRPQIRDEVPMGWDGMG